MAQYACATIQRGHILRKKYVLSAIGAVLASVLWFVFKSYTDPIFAANSVAELKGVEINGDRQWLLTRGCNRGNPVILFLHGGPGMPAMYTAHDFQRPLERDFVVAHWDQRGAGKSYRADLNPATMTMTQMLADAETVVEHLRAEFGVEKVFLVGHSHGTYFGALLAEKRPDLFHAYVGLGQIGDPAHERAVQEAIIRAKFDERGDPPPEITNANREKLLFEIGGELANARSLWPLLRTGLMAPEYNLGDVMNVTKGPQFAQAHLDYDVSGGYGPPPTGFEIPVYVVMGAEDAVTPVSLAKEWFDTVDAPEKAWIVFDNAAHFPHFEKPEEFAEFMARVRDETIANAPSTQKGAAPLPRFGLHCR